MKVPDLPGVKLSRTLPTEAVWEHHLVLELPGLCETVSSAPLGGGFGERRFIVNRSVSKSWRCDHPEEDAARYVERLGLPTESTIGLITGVGMADLRYAAGSRAGWRAYTLLTAGVGNAAAAGGRFPLDGSETPAGTVNLIVLLEGHLNPSALIDAVQSATEAKVAALRAARVTTRFGEAVTGTTTDTVTVVNLAPAPRSRYAGLATVPEFLIAETVYEALSADLG